MNAIIRNIIICSMAAAAVAAVVLGLIGSGQERRELRCRGIEVEVIDSAVNKFLDGKEVVRIVDRDFGGYVNRYADSIRLDRVESVLRRKDFIKKCEAYIGKDGILHVRISQCSPVLKIMDKLGNISYVDERGGFFPVERDWASGLKVADGPIAMNDREYLSRLAEMACRIRADKRLCSMITGIHCTPESEVMLELDSRKEKFDIGTPTDIDTKLYRIKRYLDDIAPMGLEYSRVTVKYDKQIICKIWKEQTLSQ